ncbi:hypothetical protein CH289_27220 [Rhodococcus sp. RS1C4]|nr:TetR/AcrR family transcriptional regulator [Rhodococcus sp. RS1C4]OZC42686.1 hypothetical protein CH289_27220 [Rhodococcus sp. RS1C4]
MPDEQIQLQRFAPEERQEAILRAAREVFSETGLGGARTKAIAEQAGVAEGTIFKYFKSKDVLFERAVVDVLEQLVKRVETAAVTYAGAVGEKNRVDQARQFHKETAHLMTEIAPLLGAVMSAEGNSGSQNYYDRLVGPSIGRVADALDISLKSVNQQIDPRLLSLVIFGSHFFIAMDTRSNDDPEYAAHMSESLVELLSSGFGRRH